MAASSLATTISTSSPSELGAEEFEPLASPPISALKLRCASFRSPPSRRRLLEASAGRKFLDRGCDYELFEFAVL